MNINNNFKKQLEDDIKVIQEQYGDIDPKMQQDEYAFNFWVLNKLYSMDEDVILNNITDINDKGIDCFVHYEDTKELYLIQNKYYSESTFVSREDVSDFLYTPLQLLLQGNYKRSAELQKLFSRAITDSDYNIWLHFYVTNEYRSNDIKDLINGFHTDDERINANIGAKYYTLEDIRSMYFNDRFTEKINFTAELPTRNSGTMLAVRLEEYELQWMINLRYVMVNVVDLYYVYREAVKKNYELFEENIREYLGTCGINNGIIKTLRDEKDRENFFYYNNGVTIICDKVGKYNPKSGTDFDGLKLTNPQIVNGCQTVNSIAEVLSHYNDEDLKKEFNKTFVLVKVFVFDEKTKREHDQLDVNIVKFTNSQNAISEKAFASKKNYFLNIQRDFRSRGILLLVKPSDKNKFKVEFEDKTKLAELKAKSNELLEFFGIKFKNLDSLMIPLEKLLKAMTAFFMDGYTTFVKGNTVLKPDSPLYKNFSLNITDRITIDNMIRLFFIFQKAEQDKKAGDKRHPIPYYLLDFMGRSFKEKSFTEINQKLDDLFSDEDNFNEIFRFYAKLTKTYADMYSKKAEYNVMIKQEIDQVMLNENMNMALEYTSSNTVKEFISK